MAIDKFKRVDITLDKANNYIIGDQLAKVGDIQGRDLVVQITNAGVVQSQPDIKLTLSWHNKNVGNSGMADFKPLDSSQGIFIITLPEAMNNTGNVVATIGVNEDNKWTFSRNFIIKIEENAFTASVPLESDDWATLLTALNKVDHITELSEQQLSDFIEKSKKEWAAFVEANKAIISAIDPGGVLLEEIVSARGDFATIGDRLDQTTLIETSYRANGLPQEIYHDEIARVMSSVPISTFNFGVNTDAHYIDVDEDSSLHLNRHSIWHVGNLMALATRCNLILLGGDNVDPYYPDKQLGVKDTQTLVSKFLDNDVGCDRFIILGNHDAGENGASHVYDGIGASDLNYSMVISEQEFKSLYRTDAISFGEEREDDSLYFYKDYPDKKIRFIGVVTEDTGDQLDENGNIKYLRWMAHAYRQQQLTWFANTLMTTPVDYHVVVFGHAPLREDTDPANYVDDDGNYHDSYFNNNMIANIISAWIAGKDYAGASVIPDFAATVTAPFSSRGPGNFVGFFAGHYHAEGHDVTRGFNNVWLLNSLAERSSDVSAPDRVVGTLTEDAETIVSVDTQNRKIHLTGFGAATDRELTY